jgi:hypothetical protein
MKVFARRVPGQGLDEIINKRGWLRSAAAVEVWTAAED